MLSDHLQPLPVLWCAFSARKGWSDFSLLWRGMSKQPWTLLILRPHGVGANGAGKEESRDGEGGWPTSGLEIMGIIFVTVIH